MFRKYIYPHLPTFLRRMVEKWWNRKNPRQGRTGGILPGETIVPSENLDTVVIRGENSEYPR